MSIEDFVARLDGVKQTRRGWIFSCPAHADRHPSGSVAVGEDGRLLIKCWVGCTAEEITAAMRLTLRDLFPNSNRSAEDIRRDRERRETKLVREARVREQDGLVIDACREAERFIRSRQGLDLSGWNTQTLDGELNALADAHILLEKEGLDGYSR